MSDFRADEQFPVLSSAVRREVPGAVGVLVTPPYVLVVIDEGRQAVRYWAPETLDGDLRDVGLFTLRAVPPNAPPLDAT